MNGQPVGYVVEEEAGRRRLHPAESPDRSAPILEVIDRNGACEVIGTNDPDMIEQVLHQVGRMASVPSFHLSAAP